MLSDLIRHGHDLRVMSLPRRTVPLHCMAISAGYEQRLNEVYSWDGLQRGNAPFLVVQHTLVGQGRLDFAGTQFQLMPGQTMVLTQPFSQLDTRLRSEFRQWVFGHARRHGLPTLLVTHDRADAEAACRALLAAQVQATTVRAGPAMKAPPVPHPCPCCGRPMATLAVWYHGQAPPRGPFWNDSS